MTDRMALSVSEAIRVSGLSRTTLWRAVEGGKLKCYRVGRRVLFSPDHLREFLASYEVALADEKCAASAA